MPPTPLLTEPEVERLFAALAERIDPQPELHFRSPFELTVAVLLSAQCTDRAVNRVTAELFRECRGPADLVALGEEALAERIRSLGLFRNKARNLSRLGAILLAEHGGEVPRTRAALQALPGIGRKSASVILNVAFGEPTIAVDTHVFRVANRTGLVREKSPEKTELALLTTVPPAYRRDAHHYLILHGRYTCTARKPKCPGCPVRGLCRFPAKTP